MKRATISSVCECQSRLHAYLNEERLVEKGWVTTPRGVDEKSPAHSIDASKPEFYVAWLCPYCGRNTMRSFKAEALVYQVVDASSAA